MVRPGRLEPVSEQEEQAGLGAPLFILGTAGPGAPRLQGPCSSPRTGSPWGALLPVTLRGDRAVGGRCCKGPFLHGGASRSPVHTVWCCALQGAAWCCVVYCTLHGVAHCMARCMLLYSAVHHAAHYRVLQTMGIHTLYGSAPQMALHALWPRAAQGSAPKQLCTPCGSVPCTVPYPVQCHTPFGPAPLMALQLCTPEQAALESQNVLS